MRLQPSRLRVLFLLLLLCLPLGMVTAQGSLIQYGENLPGSLTTQSPSVLFNFNAQVGDVVVIYAIATTPGLQPTLTLLGPAGLLAFNAADVTTPVSGDASLTLAIVQPGSYSILVSGANGSAGDFRLYLEALQPLEGTPLPGNQVVPLTLVPGTLPQVFTLLTSGANPTELNITAIDPEMQFVVVVRGANGDHVAVLKGDELGTAALTFAGGDASYLILIYVEGDQGGTLTISTGAQPQVEPPGPAATEAVAPGDICTVSPSGGSSINVRSGPATTFAAVGSLPVGQFLPVTGRLADNSWVQVQLAGGSAGWVAASVVTFSGPCSAVAVVDAPTAPPAQATAVVPPTATQPAGGGQQPTQPPPPVATEDQGAAPTEAPPAPPTATEIAAQIAPEDARFNTPLEVPLDGTAVSSDFVSYPGGDVEDRVRYSVTGLNPQQALPGGVADLSITATCTGTGTEYIQFSVDGRTFGCGQIILQRLATFDSNTGTVTITATGGTATYVQWTLTAIAPRR